jgi:anti-sigma regulatory factor (Ser/Thr protein kinase)
MAMEFMQPELLTLSGKLTRARALDSLLRVGLSSGSAADLMLSAEGVTDVDVVAGAAARLRICRHLRESPGGQVTIVPPRDAGTAERLLELLSPLPAGVVLSDNRAPSVQTRYGFVPATLIADSDDARLVAELALEACEAARVSDARANLVAVTLMELAENALIHVTGTVDPPVVAATVAGRERFVEVAAVDLGQGLSERSDCLDLVRQMPGAKHGGGFLADLIRLGASRDLQISIEIISGVARLRWTAARHRTERRSYVPGTTAVVRINR